MKLINLLEYFQKSFNVFITLQLLLAFTIKLIAYYSSQQNSFDDIQLKEIVRSALEKNAKNNITGMLLYANSCFFLIIEGPDDAIENLYKKPLKDRRHSTITKVLDKEITEHDFADWSIGAFKLDPDMSQNDQVFELSEQVLENKVITPSHEIIKILARTFYQSSGLSLN
jgi:hypothetical protein